MSHRSYSPHYAAPAGGHSPKFQSLPADFFSKWTASLAQAQDDQTTQQWKAAFPQADAEAQETQSSPPGSQSSSGSSSSSHSKDSHLWAGYESLLQFAGFTILSVGIGAVWFFYSPQTPVPWFTYVMAFYVLVWLLHHGIRGIRAESDPTRRKDLYFFLHLGISATINICLLFTWICLNTSSNGSTYVPDGSLPWYLYVLGGTAALIMAHYSIVYLNLRQLWLLPQMYLYFIVSAVCFMSWFFYDQYTDNKYPWFVWVVAGANDAIWAIVWGAAILVQMIVFGLVIVCRRKCLRKKSKRHKRRKSRKTARPAVAPGTRTPLLNPAVHGSMKPNHLSAPVFLHSGRAAEAAMAMYGAMGQQVASTPDSVSEDEAGVRSDLGEELDGDAEGSYAEEYPVINAEHLSTHGADAMWKVPTMAAKHVKIPPTIHSVSNTPEDYVEFLGSPDEYQYAHNELVSNSQNKSIADEAPPARRSRGRDSDERAKEADEGGKGDSNSKKRPFNQELQTRAPTNSGPRSKSRLRGDDGEAGVATDDTSVVISVYSSPNAKRGGKLKVAGHRAGGFPRGGDQAGHDRFDGLNSVVDINIDDDSAV